MALRAIWCQCDICYPEIQRQNNGVIVPEISCPPAHTHHFLVSSDAWAHTVGSLLPLGFLFFALHLACWYESLCFLHSNLISNSIKAPHQAPIVHCHKNPGITWEVVANPTTPLAASGLWEWSGIISVGIWNKFDDGGASSFFGVLMNTRIPKPTDQRSSIPHLSFVCMNSITPLIPKTVKIFSLQH